MNWKVQIERDFDALLEKGRSLEPLRQAKAGYERELFFVKRDALHLLAAGKRPAELQQAAEAKIRNCEQQIASTTVEIHATFSAWVAQLRESSEGYVRDEHGPRRARLKLLCAEAAEILAADGAAAKEYRASVVFLHKLREQLAVETREGTVQFPIPSNESFPTIPEMANEYFVRRDFPAMIAYLAQQL